MADEQKFTPGPWEVAATPQGDYQVRSVNDAPENKGYRRQVAICTLHRQNVRFASQLGIGPYNTFLHDVEANARLIAAAPEMAGLLERTHDFIDDQINPDKELMGSIEALLDKIHGNGE